MMRNPLIYLMVVFMVSTNDRDASAQSLKGALRQQQQPQDEPAKTLINVPTMTLGGKQFWSDYVHLHGYRIQKNVVTGHHRLLDPGDIRRAWGDLEGCRRELNKVVAEKELQPVRGRVLILMHGLTRTRGSLKDMGRFIESNSDIQVINVSYASSRTSIDHHADALESIIDNLPEVEEINFLGHSMGNIVVRYYLGQADREDRIRCRRMVMLAPPNHGSRLAGKLKNNLLFKTFWGVSGQQLSRGWGELEAKLATPEFEFGIVAGRMPDDSAINNPLVDGKNDLVVTVDETRLAGAADFYQQHLYHATMMSNRDVLAASLRFLEHGYFVSRESRNPIESGGR